MTLPGASEMFDEACIQISDTCPTGNNEHVCPNCESFVSDMGSLSPGEISAVAMKGIEFLQGAGYCEDQGVNTRPDDCDTFVKGLEPALQAIIPLLNDADTSARYCTQFDCPETTTPGETTTNLPRVGETVPNVGWYAADDDWRNGILQREDVEGSRRLFYGLGS